MPNQILAVLWATTNEAVGLVNDVEDGLTASIVTNNLAKAMGVAEEVDVGYVWINSSGRCQGAPSGGWTRSGIGEKEGIQELLSNTRLKNVNLRW